MTADRLTDRVAPADPIPRAALALGVAGLLPPALAVLAIAFATQAIYFQLPLFVLGSLAYAAIILSFLGGMWWGIAATKLDARAMAPWLVLAVVPALIAWPALFVAVQRPRLGAALLGLALVATLLGDRRLVAAGLAPPWWLRLRLILSCGLAVLTMAVGVLA